MSRQKHLITTAIAYANAGPHIGHAFEFVVADTYARFLRTQEDIFFITGMDEHGQKIEGKAKELNIPVQSFVDTNAEAFKSLDGALSVEYDFFVRTSDKEKHHRGAQALWEKISDAGMLEKRTYHAFYCVGCEEFKNEKDLNEEGQCSTHLKKPESVEEENWFFKLSAYGSEIKRRIENDELLIRPESRKNEILSLLERGIEDVSFSRPKSKVSWGIPVPGDESQVMYVWCDALSNYITAIGYGTEKFDEELWKNTTHIIGKDILRFHAAIWPGMLLSAGLPLPKEILVHGFITSGGQKMSKSLGNVIDPNAIIEMFSTVTKYPGEVLRFILLNSIPSFDDGDLTIDSIKASYAAHLQNGLGNLTSRIMKMATTYGVVDDGAPSDYAGLRERLEGEVRFHGNIKIALNEITGHLQELDQTIQVREPFKKIKTDPDEAKKDVAMLLRSLRDIVNALHPVIPKTSEEILALIRGHRMPDQPLFNRLP